METRSERPGQQDWKAWPDVDVAEQTLSYDQYSEYFNTTGTVYYWRVAAVDAKGTVGCRSEESTFVFNRQNHRRRPLNRQTHRTRFLAAIATTKFDPVGS